ncbi:solute carrier family 2 member 9, like 1 [Genypterus blacodes]|uniref:solute carrier family 2 member 9, like 1 n=1 Tax=Genypterus blacodes TaxID=154954 RepID=UPI003F777409
MGLHENSRMDALLNQLTRANALFLIPILGLGGSCQNGYHVTGLSSPSPFIQRFINSSWYHRYEEPPPPHTVTLIWSVIVSTYAVGGLFGALSIKCVTGLVGIKKGIICNSLVSIVAAAIMFSSKGAESIEMVVIARGLFGFSAGMGMGLHLMYLGEISPQKIRGKVTLTLATFTSFGKLLGRFFGLSEILGREELWNILLIVPTCFSVLQLLGLPFFPEAPRYLLIEKGDQEACKKALQSLWGRGDYKQEIDEMLAEQAAINVVRPKSTLEVLRDRNVRWRLITVVTISSCLLLSGMPAISIFSFDIFLEAGIPAEYIRYITLGLGGAEILAFMFCGFIIEHTGRRVLLWVGLGAMSATLVLITVTLTLKDYVSWFPYTTVGLINLFIIFQCGGPAGTISTLSHEIFIQSDRPAALVISGIIRWLLFCLLSMIFPFLVSALGSYCFVLFACMAMLGSLYTFFLLPETKGKSLLEISEAFKDLTVCRKSFKPDKSVQTKL